MRSTEHEGGGAAPPGPGVREPRCRRAITTSSETRPRCEECGRTKDDEEMITQAHRVSPVTDGQIPIAGAMLAQAFIDDPLCVYTQPDIDARVIQFAWFFAQLVRDGVIQNGAYGLGALGRPDGVAVWQPPDSDLDTSIEREHDELRDLFGPEAYERFSTYRYFEEVHRRCMECPHWSLTLVGVLPSAQGRGIGGSVVAPFLKRADG